MSGWKLTKKRGGTKEQYPFTEGGGVGGEIQANREKKTTIARLHPPRIHAGSTRWPQWDREQPDSKGTGGEESVSYIF